MGRRFLLALALLGLAFRLTAQTNEPIKLALVAESDEASAIADLLTVPFSANPHLHLLERGDIAKVYHEQELSADNKDYVKMGRILGADGLLLLEPLKIGTNKFIRSRLVAVKTGIVIRSERFPRPADNSADWAPRFVNHLQPLLSKLAVPARDAVPISVVNLRAAFQSEEEHDLERDVTLLTSERLTQEQRVFVLERRKMQSLSAEKELESVEDGAFWNGAYLLDGTLDRDGYSKEKMTLDARLVPPQNGTPFQVHISVSRTNLSEMVSQLTRQVLDHLQISADTMRWNTAEEASQYENEAQWALRWGFFEVAQSASESAWALGNRSRDMAALRIRAYSESVLPNDYLTANILVPAVPDPACLQPAARALALYCENSALVLTNAARPDLEWFDIGVKALLKASSLLNIYYGSVELRRQNAEALSELRELNRHILPTLDAQASEVEKIRKLFVNGKPSPKGVRFESQAFNNCDLFYQTKWDLGGFFYDTAEASLPMFRAMINSLYLPENMPCIIGWSWEDRKRVPQLAKQLVRELCASTNTEIRLMGRYLSVLRAPNDEAGSLEAATSALTAEMWNHREILFTNLKMAPIFAKTEDALRQKYGIFAPSTVQQEPFASFRRRLRMDYLTNDISDRNHSDIFGSILSRDNYSKEEAQELLPLMQRLNQQDVADMEYRNVVQAMAKAAGTNLVIAPPPFTIKWDHLASLPAAEMALLRFLPWNLNGHSHEPDTAPWPARLICRNGALWCRVLYATRQRNFLDPRHDLPMSFVHIDQDTGQCDEIAFPLELGQPNAGFDVSSNAIYVSAPGKLAWHPLAGGTWETLALPTQSLGDVLAFNGRIYIANADNVLEINPETRSIETLAASRRYPAVNDLDRALGPISGLFAGWDNQLGVYTATNVFLFQSTKHDWNRLPLSNESFPANSSWYPSKGGVQILSSRRLGFLEADRSFIGYSANHVGPELLLKQRTKESDGSSRPIPPLGHARWDWPEPFRLDIPSFHLENDTVWFLQSRKLKWPMMGVKEPIDFTDKRLATLLRFGPDSRLPLVIPLGFENTGPSYDPFVPSMILGSPFQDLFIPPWIVTDKGVVIVAIEHQLGHWFLPMTEVDKQWRAFLNSSHADAGKSAAIP